MKFLLNSGIATGRQTSDQLKLPFGIVQKLLQGLKSQMLVNYKSSAPMSDYQYELTDAGIERARRCHERCSYFGAAPISLNAYRESVSAQSIRTRKPKLADMCRAYDDLLLEPAIISRSSRRIKESWSIIPIYSPLQQPSLPGRNST